MAECKQCKKRTLKSYNRVVVPVSIYLLITSIIGTITLVKYISSLF